MTTELDAEAHLYNTAYALAEIATRPPPRLGQRKHTESDRDDLAMVCLAEAIADAAKLYASETSEERQ